MPAFSSATTFPKNIRAKHATEKSVHIALCPPDNQIFLSSKGITIEKTALA